MYIRRRERDVLDILLKNQGLPTSRYDIAQQLGVSSRTVHRELNNLDATLAPFSIKIDRLKNQGLLLNGTTDAITQLEAKLSQETVVDLTTEEQKVIILYALIQSEQPVKQVGLASEIGASLAQLNKVLDALETDLQSFNLTLERKRGVGISLHGSEMHKRELLSQLMMERLNSTSVYSVIENHFVFQSLNYKHLPMVDMNEIFQVERLLMDDLELLPYTLTESSYLSLIVHIVLSIERIRNHQFVSIHADTLADIQFTKEYLLASQIAQRLEYHYQLTFEPAEIAFITIHLRGSKRRNDKDTQHQLKYEPQVTELIYDVTKQTGIHFRNIDELSEGLRLHLPPALNRIHAQIETYNPMTTRIQSAYPILFKAVKHAVGKIWPSLHFPDYEIAFIVLHFGGALPTRQHKLNVLVVCSSGVGTSRILANRLVETFPMIHTTTQMSVSELHMQNLTNYDAVISTVELDIDYPYLTVNPLLPEHEISKTSAFLTQQTSVISNEFKFKPYIFKSKNKQSDNTVAMNQKIDAMRESLQLLDSFESVQTNLTNWAADIAQHLSIQQKTDNPKAIESQLLDRHAQQSFVLSPFEIAIPHLIHDHILSPYIGVWHLKQPYQLSKDSFVRTLFCVFLPEHTQLQPLVSEIYGQLSIALDDGDKVLSNFNQIEEWIKAHLIAFNQK